MRFKRYPCLAVHPRFGIIEAYFQLCMHQVVDAGSCSPVNGGLGGIGGWHGAVLSFYTEGKDQRATNQKRFLHILCLSVVKISGGMVTVCKKNGKWQCQCRFSIRFARQTP